MQAAKRRASLFKDKMDMKILKDEMYCQKSVNDYKLEIID